MSEQSALDRVVSRVGDLPAMPSVVAATLRVTDDPSADMDEVARAIQGDPALTAKILRVSNSSYYGMKQYVGTLKLALVILGVREVRNIVLGISVFESLKDKTTDSQIAQEIWNRSLRAAGIAKKVAMQLEMGLQGEEFITGLLSQIGIMVLLRQSEKYKSIYLKHKDSTTDLHLAELKNLGFTNADAAMALAMRWNLPQTMVDALWLQYPRQEKTLAQAKDPMLAALIRLAGLAVCEDFTKPDAEIPLLHDREIGAVLNKSVKSHLVGDRKAYLMGVLEELKQEQDIPLYD